MSCRGLVGGGLSRASLLKCRSLGGNRFFPPSQQLLVGGTAPSSETAPSGRRRGLGLPLSAGGPRYASGGPELRVTGITMAQARRGPAESIGISAGPRRLARGRRARLASQSRSFRRRSGGPARPSLPGLQVGAKIRAGRWSSGCTAGPPSPAIHGSAAAGLARAARPRFRLTRTCC